MEANGQSTGVRGSRPGGFVKSRAAASGMTTVGLEDTRRLAEQVTFVSAAVHVLIVQYQPPFYTINAVQ